MRKPTVGKSIALLGILALSAALLAPAALAAARGEAPAPQPGNPQPGARRMDARMLMPGQAAPDVELARLIIEKDKSGNPVGKLSQEKVKLSSLAGSKPVCLIFTSYT
jgi:hypothetical protein